ncbi:MAG: iron ABC transporter permease [Gemmatimonadales bacterium]
MRPVPSSPPRAAVVVVVTIAFVACIAGLMIGTVPIAPADALRALIDPDAADAPIVRLLRAPRVLLAFGVGGVLAVAGASLQALVRNPLAEPWILGLSGGASLGAVVATVVGLPAGWGIPACATAGALGAVALVYRISRIADQHLDPRVLLLAGVIVGAFASAITTLVLIFADPMRFRSATLWILGGFSGASWHGVRDFAIVAVVPSAVLLALARQLDLLALGDEPALALGADVDRTRTLVVVMTSILTAATVASAGVIGFVGLVVPHALRWTIGPMHRRLLPLAFLAGGAFTVAADTLARTVAQPAELPVGAITAIVGVPLFAVLLRRTIQ